MTLLIWLTIVAIAAVVVVVAGYLIAVNVSLARTRRTLVRLAEGLEAIDANTRPLAGHLTTINGAAGQLLTDGFEHATTTVTEQGVDEEQQLLSDI